MTKKSLRLIDVEPEMEYIMSAFFSCESFDAVSEFLSTEIEAFRS